MSGFSGFCSRDIQFVFMKTRLWKTLHNLDTLGGCVALVIVILSVTYGVVMRYLFGDPPVWTNEVSAIAFTWLVFLGASAAYKRKMHIGIDLLVKRAPRKARWLIELIGHLILSVFFGFMVVYGLIFSVESSAQPTSIMRLPNTCFYLAVPVSFALMLLDQLAGIRNFILSREVER